MEPDVLWEPEGEAFVSSNVARFARRHGFDPAAYESFHAWSVSDPSGFWSGVWDFAAIIGEKGDVAFVADPVAPMTGAKFFPHAKLNLAENILKGSSADSAVLAVNEAGDFTEFSRGALRDLVAKTANGLRAAGIMPGDCVAGIMPNRLEALVAMLATLAVGGIWSSCSPDFGKAAIVDRIGQIKPKLLFATARYRYGGKDFDVSDRLVEIVAAMPSVGLLVCDGDLPRLGGVRAVAFDGFGEAGDLVFEQVAFAHPSCVLYTSGTTGAPKAIVHSTGGVLLEHVKEHLLHGDMRPGDTLLWYTNIAWMMYPWMVSALACGARIGLYDGAPIVKSAGGLDCSPLWQAADQCGVTHLGVSPKYLSTLAAERYFPKDRHKLENMRWLMSAGAPMAPAQFDWIYEHVKTDMSYASISGGTEILGCFLLGSPVRPVRRGYLTVKSLGMAVNVLDERNAPVLGQRGDLVCTEPFPSMPLTFWGEGGDERYRATYFSKRAEIWTHGDIAELNEFGGAIIHGRSDSTLNPGGVRIGSAEIYAACDGIAAIEDCVVFGARHEGDEEVVLCLKLVADQKLDEALCQQVRGAIRGLASPFHVPKRIHRVRDVPYTLNGKRVEGAVRAIVAGMPVKNRASLANPECLEEFAELRREDAL